MSPWTIIGWTLLVVLGGATLIVLWFLAETYVIPALWRRWHHLRTRNVSPVKGQVWMQGDTRLHIDRIADNGRIVIHTYGGMSRAGWSDSPEEWRDRVKYRRVRATWGG